MRTYVATRAESPDMHRVRTSVRENQLTDPSQCSTTTTSHWWKATAAPGSLRWTAGSSALPLRTSRAPTYGRYLWSLKGHGIGRRLHDGMMDWFFAAGAQLVWLSTDPATRAAGLYRAAGWRHAGQEQSGEVRFEMARQEWMKHREGGGIRWVR